MVFGTGNTIKPIFQGVGRIKGMKTNHGSEVFPNGDGNAEASPFAVFHAVTAGLAVSFCLVWLPVYLFFTHIGFSAVLLYASILVLSLSFFCLRGRYRHRN